MRITGIYGLVAHGNNQGSHGGNDAQQGNPHGRVAVEGIGAYLGTGGFHIDHVVLLEVEVGGGGDVCLGEVEVIHLAAAGRVFTHQLYVVAYGEQGHVACLGNGFEDGDFLVAYLIGARSVYFAQYAELIIGGAYRYVGYFFQVGFQQFAEMVFTFAVGHTHHVDHAQDGEIDVAVVIDQVGQQFGISHSHGTAAASFLALSDFAVEGSRCFRVGSTHRDGQFVFRHDAEIVKLALGKLVQCLLVLQVERFLIRRTSRREQQQKKAAYGNQFFSCEHYSRLNC